MLSFSSPTLGRTANVYAHRFLFSDFLKNSDDLFTFEEIGGGTEFLTMNKRHFYLFSGVLHVSLQARLYFAHTVFTVYSTGDVPSTTLLLSSFAHFFFNEYIPSSSWGMNNELRITRKKGKGGEYGNSCVAQRCTIPSHPVIHMRVHPLSEKKLIITFFFLFPFSNTTTLPSP